MGYDTKTEVCGHGFRTMARGAMGESGLWSDDAIERQLSHSNVTMCVQRIFILLNIWMSDA
jgi:integrase